MRRLFGGIAAAVLVRSNAFGELLAAELRQLGLAGRVSRLP